LVLRLERKIPFEVLGCGWKENMKMDLREIGLEGRKGLCNA
jgi:hypothetical protein